MVSKRLLLIEDDPCFRMILEKFLRGYTENIFFHTSTESALCELEKGETFDAIISDYNLPDKNGDYILKKIRNNGDDTPYIILTANTFFLQEHPDIKGIVSKVLYKSSVCKEELINTLKSILKKSKETIVEYSIGKNTLEIA